jgi:hypothetical protein
VRRLKELIASSGREIKRPVFVDPKTLFIDAIPADTCSSGEQ